LPSVATAVATLHHEISLEDRLLRCLLGGIACAALRTMSLCKSLLICSSLLTLQACDASGLDPGDCQTGRCDDPSQSIADGLMPGAPTTPGVVGISRNQDQWLFEVIGQKGEIVLLSEDYVSKSAVRNGILSVEENGVHLDRYKVQEVAGSWSFVLRAGNNEVIADSQTFASEAEAQAAVAGARDLVAGIVQYRAALDTGAKFGLDRDGSNWEFDLVDENGDVLLKSQVYSGRTDALTGIASVRNNGKDGPRYRLLDSPPRFILNAANGQEIAESSRTYPTLDAAQGAIDETQALLRSERVANPW
jgi:uncharacterized protein YegP (UPF0339 family)